MLEISTGAIIYTIIQDQIKYLVIKDNHGNYGFPKGHIENNESQLQAAYREIKEEVGLDVVIDDNFKEELRYPLTNGNDKLSIYYIASYHNQQPIRQLEEVQEILLLSFQETLDILTFDTMKNTLIKANKYINDIQKMTD